MNGGAGAGAGARTLTRVDCGPQALILAWDDGTVGEFASVWLRDNDRADRDPHSGQRLIDVADLPVEPRLRSAIALSGELRVEWQDGAASAFDLDWLAAQAGAAAAQRPELLRKPWLNGAALDALRDFAWASVARVRNEPRVRGAWLTRLLQDGLAFFNEVPPTETAILEAMSLVGRIVETNYGAVFDVRAVGQPENLAYSDRGLGLHTDNPYREPVPGFQALHVLVASPAGGESLFADGYALALHLRRTDAAAFAKLSGTAVPFLYRSKDAELYAERPLIQLTCDGAVCSVHYNSRSIAPLRQGAADLQAFYAAYRRFACLLRDPQFQLRFMLRDGDLAVFDNQRILHGRTGFSSAKYPRHLRGCYLSRDSVYSEAALLRRAQERESRR